MYQSPKNPNTHLTVKERRWPSFPTKQLFLQQQITGRVLDFGCGTGVDVKFLRENNLDVTGYDPYYAPDYPTDKFDTILCNYVLNILLPEEQAHVLMAVSELLKPTGKAYFAVRRDIKHNGFRTHTKHRYKVYQCNVVLPYKSILTTEHCEVYEYQHFNQREDILITDCPFCRPEGNRELITESATAYAMLDKYPVSSGHTLIIPKQHISDYFELPDRVKTACWLIADRVKILLSQRFQPNGFNIGINVGQAAGQTIPHAHIHVIPRYTGDIENPTGGVRHVIPGKGNYLLC
ncbi:MAG: HIT domain-containing protein [Anaerolineales bacterium]|nr:HIT domain-containing protein [Anaerolineales bacterium]